MREFFAELWSKRAEDIVNSVVLLICAALFAYLYSTLASVFILIPTLYAVYLVGSAVLLSFLGYELDEDEPKVEVYIITDSKHTEHATIFASAFLQQIGADEVEIQILTDEVIVQLAEIMEQNPPEK